MTSSPSSSPPVVVDAGFAVAAVLFHPTSPDFRSVLARWYRGDRALLAPAHWLSEAVSTLRKLQFAGQIAEKEARRATSDLFVLGIASMPLDEDLCHSALRWAEELTQAKAYDAFYVALAERENAELWTADRRLARRARQLGAGWVRTLADDSPAP